MQIILLPGNREIKLNKKEHRQTIKAIRRKLKRKTRRNDQNMEITQVNLHRAKLNFKH